MILYIISYLLIIIIINNWIIWMSLTSTWAWSGRRSVCVLKSHEYQKFLDQRLQSNMSSVASDTASSKQQGEQPSKKTKPASKFGNLKPKRLQQLGPTDVKGSTRPPLCLWTIP